VVKDLSLALTDSKALSESECPSGKVRLSEFAVEDCPKVQRCCSAHLPHFATLEQYRVQPGSPNLNDVVRASWSPQGLTGPWKKGLKDRDDRLTDE
jgi:hypothetical protein